MIFPDLIYLKKLMSNLIMSNLPQILTFVINIISSENDKGIGPKTIAILFPCVQYAISPKFNKLLEDFSNFMFIIGVLKYHWTFEYPITLYQCDYR